MAEQEMAGEDASLDAATARIMGIGMSNLVQDQSKLDRLEDTGGEVDLNDATGTTDLEEIERSEALKAEAKEAEAKGDGEDADAGEETAQFIELPPTEEGQEPERIPVAEMAEAYKQYRQLQGDMASAVIKAEEEAYQKQDQYTQGLAKTFDAVREQAQLAMEAMRAYFPKEPDPVMLDRQSGYYDPEGYHLAKLSFDKFQQHYQWLQTTAKKADEGKSVTTTQVDSEQLRRENDRIARYIPEWKDEKGREAFKSSVVDALGAKYGISKADVDDIVDHKAWRIMSDYAKLLNAQKQAPEVRKAVQEKAPKLVNGRPPASRDAQTGQFLSKARTELKQSGSEDAFVNFLLAGKRTPARPTQR